MLLLLKTARAEGKPPTLFTGAHGMFARAVPVWFGDEKDSEPIPQTEYTNLDLALCRVISIILTAYVTSAVRRSGMVVVSIVRLSSM